MVERVGLSLALKAIVISVVALGYRPKPEIKERSSESKASIQSN